MASGRVMLNEYPIPLLGGGTGGLGQVWNESEGDAIVYGLDVSSRTPQTIPSDPAEAKRLVISQGPRFYPQATTQQQVQNPEAGYNFGYLYALTLHVFVGVHADPISGTVLVCDMESTFACFLRGAGWDAPAKDSSISIEVDDTTDIAAYVTACGAADPPIDPIVGIDTMGWYRVDSIDDATHFTGTNLDIACAPVTVFGS